LLKLALIACVMIAGLSMADAQPVRFLPSSR
jgi:hypothetical protein